jgi:hypothetical protein
MEKIRIQLLDQHHQYWLEPCFETLRAATYSAIFGIFRW